jgi:hypothetical protein
VKEQTVITADEINTWDDYEKKSNKYTNGFLAQLSPDGRYVVGMVKDLFVITHNSFEDFFFPIRGILVVYDRKNETYYPLPGADDPEYVQCNPCWSPDGKTIVFIRAKAADYKYDIENYFLYPEEGLEYLETIDGFCYDLYRVSFNDGAGGTEG